MLRPHNIRDNDIRKTLELCLMHIENKFSGEIKFDVFEAASVRIVTLIRKLCLAGNLIFVYSFSILCLCFWCYVDVYFALMLICIVTML